MARLSGVRSARSGRAEWTSREMTKLEGCVQTSGPASCSGEGANRQRVILIVHLHLNPITLLEFSHHLGGWFGMQMHFLTVRLSDVKVIPVNAQHFALDAIDALHCVLIGRYAITVPTNRQVRFLSLCSLRLLSCLYGSGQSQVQQAPTRQDPDQLGYRDHERPLRLEIQRRWKTPGTKNSQPPSKGRKWAGSTQGGASIVSTPKGSGPARFRRTTGPR